MESARRTRDYELQIEGQSRARHWRRTAVRQRSCPAPSAPGREKPVTVPRNKPGIVLSFLFRGLCRPSWLYSVNALRSYAPIVKDPPQVNARPEQPSVIYTFLRFYPFTIGVLDLIHFRDCVSPPYHFWMRVSPGQDKVHQ